MAANYYLGIDVGSVSTNVVVTDGADQVVAKVYLKTQGNPIEAIKQGLSRVREQLPNIARIQGVGATGSGRQLAAAMVGADVVKNEITAHGIAALSQMKEVQTILEIGGQDSKMILLRKGVISDFAMNTVCAAGTGSFLDRQAARLGVPIEEFGALALQASGTVRIAGRCAVFAESDMIHKQQLGHSQAEIVKGLCDALVRNFLNNLAKGKELKAPIFFQGGVAANVGIKQSFEEALGCSVIVPEHHEVMGAIGCCILAREEAERKKETRFRGFKLTETGYSVKSYLCGGCANNCEVVNIYQENQLIASWGNRCQSQRALA